MTMTSEQIQARLDSAVARLGDLQTELDRKDAILRSGHDVNGDGRFDEGDVREVQRVRNRRDQVEERIEVLRSQLITRRAEEDGTPIDYIDFEDEGTFIEGDTHRKPYTEDLGTFKNNIRTWRNSVRESLGRMVNTMLDPDNPGPGFPKNDIVSLATTALSASQPQLATAIGVANTMLDLATNAYQRSLPSTPSLREIETNWRDSLNEITDSVAEDAYHELWAVFRDANHMEPDEEYVYASYIPQWDALLNSFQEGDVMPSSDSINRAFMTHIISQMPDSPWDMDWGSGEVTVYMEFDLDRNAFSFSSGSMDDITSEVKKALKADPDMFGSSSVTSLPVAIRFHVSGSGWLDGAYCELYRREKVSGSTNFQMIPIPIHADASMEEQGTMFQIFMNRRIYDTVNVSQIL